MRHGQTAGNAEARLQGDTDLSLDEVGKLQAARAGAHIRGKWQVDLVVASSLLRSQQSANLAGFPADAVTTDDRWREISFGEFEGRRIKEVVPDLGSRWLSDINYAPKGGETLASLHSRVVDACEDLAEQAETENVLVVTHANPIKAAVAWAVGGGPQTILHQWVHPGSVSAIEIRSGHAMLVGFNYFEESP